MCNTYNLNYFSQKKILKIQMASFISKEIIYEYFEIKCNIKAKISK